VDRPANARAFPFDQFPPYLLGDRDAIFAQDFRDQVRDMGIEEVLSAPRSPWQRAYVERIIGSIRRECLDHVIVFGESSLRRTLVAYFDYYRRSRTHLSLGKDSPEPRPIQSPEIGQSCRCVRSMDCTTATNDTPPETAKTRKR
jgi:putative transposase